MRFTAFLPALLASVALAAPFGAATLEDDLKKLDADIVELGKVVDTFTGQPEVAININTYADKLTKDIKTATSNLKKSTTTFTTADVAPIVKVFDTFIPNSQSVIDKVIAKKAAFDSSSTSAVVYSDLKVIKDAGNKLSDLIYSKAPADAKSIEKEKWSQITAILDAGLKVYNQD